MFLTPRNILIFSLLSILLLSNGFAAETDNSTVERPINVNLSTGDLKLEIEGLEDTLKILGDSVQTLSARIKTLAEKPDLSEEEVKLIRQLVSELNKTVLAATEISNSLPEKIRESQGPISDIGKEITSQIRSLIIFSILALVIAIIAVLYYSYRFIIRPIQHVADKMEVISSSIEKTVDRVAELDAARETNAGNAG